MKNNMYIYYDKEGDFLEITLGVRTKGYFRDAGEGISERIDEKTGRVIGLAILSFKKRTEGMKDFKIKLPLTFENNF